jgi:hypothetical protein
MRVHNELALALQERGFSSVSEAISYGHRGADVFETTGEGELEPE